VTVGDDVNWSHLQACVRPVEGEPTRRVAPHQPVVHDVPRSKPDQPPPQEPASNLSTWDEQRDRRRSILRQLAGMSGGEIFRRNETADSS
jgi:hypothetical protein